MAKRADVILGWINRGITSSKVYVTWSEEKEETDVHLMEKGEGENQTSITKFILLGFGNLPELHIIFFLLFLVIYIVTMAANMLIAALVVADQHLHTPMYFFLGNLSCLEICYTSTILPRVLASLLTGNRTISVSQCIIQFYCFALLLTTECYLLAVMSFDRYLAICKPLHYVTRMNGRFCIQLAAGSWISSFILISILISLVSQLAFCGPNEIDHFFCDLTPVIKLSCSNTSLVTLVTLIFASIDTVPPFLLTLTSYVYIISTILRIPSTTGRQKAFSTCSSHLIVVTIFYATLITVYILPNTGALRAPNKVFSVLYTVFTPLINPLIYSLRNKEVKEVLRRALQKCDISMPRAEHEDSSQEGDVPTVSDVAEDPVYDQETQQQQEDVDLMQQEKFISTTDCSHKEETTMVIRYIKIVDSSKFSIEEKFILFDNFTRKTGKEIAAQVLTNLERFKLDFQVCIGQAYDNGANMAGKYKGVQAVLLEHN
ncbi:olfactory receptor 11A1-like [Emys orbicularis]|uniref:olfactory receptor 11A1-like n=1 Tax=Emys orbicularis TaxID=82168 RepID=UPI0031FD047C